LLKQLGLTHNFNVVGVEAVKLNGEVVSSTTIRRAVAEGNLIKATQMLGREYTILGTVIPGEKLGRKLGFPTANLSAHSEQFPPNGVYVAEARLAGSLHRGVANLGYRPTVAAGKPERLLELHLFDLEREIYGEEMEVRFLRYLRPEQKFENLDALKAQIARDVEQARESFSVRD
jgi:riboflavin kinase/FMN adenylyltransferase